jgi:Putative Se/S carrier protein-like
VADDPAGIARGRTAREGSGRHALFTFETAHDAVAAEAVLSSARVALDEVPPPDGLEAGCGVAVRVSLKELYEAIGALATEGAPWQAVYEVGERQEVVAKLG